MFRRQITFVLKKVRYSSCIAMVDGKLQVPSEPIIPFIEGDGSGPDIWRAAKHVIDSAVERAYGNSRKIQWLELYAGEKSVNMNGEWLPEDTIQKLQKHLVAIKGPLESPRSESGVRSLQTILRQKLDLYCSMRPIHYTEGLPSPMIDPTHTHCVIFRESTEDVYAGIEFPSGTKEAADMYDFLVKHKMGSKVRFPNSTGYGVKPISSHATQRIVRAAIQYALKKNSYSPSRKIKNLVLVHKGNIMKFTEGGFKDWGYNVVTKEFRDKCVTEKESWILENKENGVNDVYESAKLLEPGYDMMTENQQKATVEEIKTVLSSIWESHGNGKWKSKLMVRDTIADITLQQIMTRTKEFDVIVTMALNGAYISDALAAQVGGVGLAPGGNFNFETGHAIFEASHGLSPKYAGLDKINPGGLISSGDMMLSYIGWTEASDLIKKGMRQTLKNRTVTFDLKRMMEKDEGTEVSCSEFSKLVVSNM